MYSSLLYFHSIWRWAVLISLVAGMLTGFQGLYSRRLFSKWDNAARHWTATIAHIQLVLGIMLYTRSPVVKLYWQSGAGTAIPDSLFFAIIHALLMLASIVVITIGSAMAKRKPTNEESFRTMAVYYTIALLLILISIPWPISPLAQRPLIP